MRTLVAAIAIIASPASALTGNDAIQHFTGNENKLLRLEIYTNGVVDAEVAVLANARAAAKTTSRYIRPFCMPRGASISQAAMVVGNQLQRKPEDNHLDLYIVARRALIDAWPCTDEQVFGAD